LEDLGLDRRIILKELFKEVGFRGMDWIAVPQNMGEVKGYCSCGNEPSFSTKCGEFLS